MLYILVGGRIVEFMFCSIEASVLVLEIKQFPPVFYFSVCLDFLPCKLLLSILDVPLHENHVVTQLMYTAPLHISLRIHFKILPYEWCQNLGRDKFLHPTSLSMLIIDENGSIYLYKFCYLEILGLLLYV